MKLIQLFKGDTLQSLLINISAAIGVILLLGVSYFYIYLPNATNHGDENVVPDLTGLSVDELENTLKPFHLRFEVGDSSYSADQPPLTVLQQFPKPGHRVKENRRIYVSINRSSAPTLPLPNLIELGGGSLANAKAVLKSNELVFGRVIYKRGPFRDYILEMRMNGREIAPGSRIPKGSVIDLVVGDGGVAKYFIMGNIVGIPYQNALLRLENLSLNLGDVEIPEGADTTGIVSYVLKQFPLAGDSISIGDPVNLWIGPKDFKLDDPDEENEN